MSPTRGYFEWDESYQIHILGSPWLLYIGYRDSTKRIKTKFDITVLQRFCVQQNIPFNIFEFICIYFRRSIYLNYIAQHFPNRGKTIISFIFILAYIYYVHYHH